MPRSRKTTGARSIADGETANHTNRSFYLAARPFATDHAEAWLKAILDALAESDAWAADEPGRRRQTGRRRDRD